MTIPISIFNRHRLRGGAVAALAAVLGLVTAGCGGSSSSSPPTGGVAGTHKASGTMTVTTTVTTHSVNGLGNVLADAQGRTLYAFMRDQHRRVTCTGSCATVWLPLKAGSMPTAGGTAQASLLGTDMNPAGGSVVTYSKWPLYTYTGDSGPGMANGEALNLNGGRWYVISASGQLVKTKKSSGGGATTTGGGGSGYGTTTSGGGGGSWG